MSRSGGSYAGPVPRSRRDPGTFITLACALILCSTQARSDSLNSVTGNVTILDRQGNDVGDHSGVVVFLDGVGIGDETGSSGEIMSHKGRRFSPAVLPIVRGTTIDFLNDDDIYHNVFSLSVTKPFDLGIYPEGASKLISFDEPGLIRIYCNLHPEMVSTILVLNNRFFAKTDVQGRFEITGIPDGDYTLRVWYEYGQEQARAVSLSDSARLEEAFTVETTKRRRKHKNKFGKPYRQKY